MQRKYIVIAIILVVITIGFITNNQIPDMKPIYNIRKLVAISHNETLFLKSKAWGMTYDNKLIILSASDGEEFMADSTKDYVYKGASFIFYKISNDSLFIYTDNKAHIPPLFDSKFIIKQIKLENPAMMKLKGDSAYKNLGLTEFK